jgi:hypothetical protein
MSRVPIPCFVELPPFERHRESYLGDLEYRELQSELIKNPKAGTVIRETGGLRKLRFDDKRRGKGRRGGLRVIYYYWVEGLQFWLFSIYDKDEANDLTAKEKKDLKLFLDAEIAKRTLI